MSDTLIDIRGLEKSFGLLKAVNGISFAVRRGEVLGFLGPNGAGKSTTMKMITGYLSPSAGTAFVAGFDIGRDRLAAQRAIGYLPEGAPSYGDMTPRGYLRFIAEVRGLKADAALWAIDRAVERADLAAVLDQPIETLSKGFKRRVGLAQAILHDPPILILDEPTDGLDPNQKHAVRQLIVSMAASKSIIISTHILEEVEAVCSRALIIDRGRVVADGTPEQLMARSPHHNAVTVVVGAATRSPLAEALQALPEVDRVEVEDAGETRVRLTAVPAGERAPIDAVSDLIKRDGFPVQGLYVESGRLDEVFRTLTSLDTGGHTDQSKAAAS